MCHERWTRCSEDAVQGLWLRDLSRPADEPARPHPPVSEPPREDRVTEPVTPLVTADR